MESGSIPQVPTFWTLAVGRGLLTAEAARELEAESSASSLRPGDLVLRKGMLNAMQVDIVDTLLRPHDVIPGYELQDVLGHGGMGVVYRARQKTLGREVALKTILIDRMLDTKAAARFEQEALAIGRLQHAHIVNAFDFGRHEGRLFLAMEFVRGKDLDHLITQSDELSEGLVWSLGRQAVLGLAYAAKTGVVHRDIKPANLLLDQSGDLGSGDVPTVKIADFGLAFLADESDSRTRLTADHAAVGSPHYIAPEQLQGSRVDFRADIYALGATLFHALAGNAPFAGKSVLQIATAKVTGALPRLKGVRPGISDETDELIAWMMQPDPAHRPKDYKELLGRIDQILMQGSEDVTTAVAERESRGSDADERTREMGRVSALERGEGSVPAARKGFCWQRWSVIGLMLLIAGVVGWSLWPQKAGVPVRGYVAAKRSASLFNGKELNTAIFQAEPGGLWRLGMDDEKAPVIEGKGEMLVRLLHPVKSGNGLEVVQNPRLSFQVRLNEAKQVEVVFGLPLKGGEARGLRLSAGKIELGRVSVSPWEFRTLQTVALTGEDPKKFDVQIDREENRGWVQVEGRESPGFYLTGREFQPVVRIKAEGGAAWFSDFELIELIPRK